MSDRPPHPGSRPSQLEFPSAQADAAVEALETMADQLDDLRRRLDDAMADVNSTKFLGLFADWFNERGLALEAESRDTTSRLREDADALRSHIRTSEAAVTTRDRAIGSWRDAWRAYDNWEA